MRRIIGKKVTELCIELCQRIGDVYEGPYYVSIKDGNVALTFWGRKSTYIAIPTQNGLSVKDEKGTDIAIYPDILDITF